MSEHKRTWAQASAESPLSEAEAVQFTRSAVTHESYVEELRRERATLVTLDDTLRRHLRDYDGWAARRSDEVLAELLEALEI